MADRWLAGTRARLGSASVRSCLPGPEQGCPLRCGDADGFELQHEMRHGIVSCVPHPTVNEPAPQFSPLAAQTSESLHSCVSAICLLVFCLDIRIFCIHAPIWGAEIFHLHLIRGTDVNSSPSTELCGGSCFPPCQELTRVVSTRLALPLAFDVCVTMFSR